MNYMQHFIDNFFSLYPIHLNLMSFMLGAFWAASYSYFRRYHVFGIITLYVLGIAAYYAFQYYRVTNSV